MEPRGGVGVYKVAMATRAYPRTVVVGRPGAFDVRWAFLTPLFALTYSSCRRCDDAKQLNEVRLESPHHVLFRLFAHPAVLRTRHRPSVGALRRRRAYGRHLGGRPPEPCGKNQGGRVAGLPRLPLRARLALALAERRRGRVFAEGGGGGGGRRRGGHP